MPTLVLKTDTNPGVARWEEEAGGGFEEVTVLTAASPDLEAEATQNIAYVGDNLSVNQPLPNPGASGRRGYRLLVAATGESGIALTYGGAGGVVGPDSISGGTDFNSATIIYDSDTDAWYVYAGTQ